ncbi:MAG: insulinase family protein [Prevotellaceae bacterium]|jgi:zinc protease|nr:insulinase family protein [Prevotellaceae bacterium]
MRKILLSIAIAAMCIIAVNAQINPMERIPVDKNVKTGKLDNGLTYYVKANAKPEKQAEFFIFHYVGAAQEEDNQQGLAHFLEHMAFNGTTNFPDKKLITWCESVGIKFGQNLNASTSMEQTVYNISAVPLDKPENLDTCLLILHDWSQFIALKDDEIDKERGVILEEKRTRNTASWRMSEKVLPVLYGDTRYSKRNIIGTDEILKNFKYDEIRDFYHRWYRTDMQCIVVVGDFDADVVVEKIKTIFADVKPVENPEAKGFYPLPKNTEPIVSAITDPEATSTNVSIYIKHDPAPREMEGTYAIYMIDLIKSLTSRMANARFNEIILKPNAPFISGYVGAYRITASCDAIRGRAMAREGESLIALEALYGEIEKIRRFGFTESELEIAKANYLKESEVYYNNRNDNRHTAYIYPFINHFKYNDAIPDEETDWKLVNDILPQINLTLINEIAKQLITLENQIVLIEAPEKQGTYPDEAEIKAVIEKVRAAELEAYKDNVVKQPIIPEEIVLNGSPVAKEETDKFGATVWTLQNGVKVIVKQTDFKADEIVISISARDGSSNVSDDDFNTASYMASVMSNSGTGKLNAIDLNKQLAGKTATVSINVSDYSTVMSAGGSPKDIETILQLVYMNFTNPRWDENDFNVVIDSYKSQLKNMEDDPRYIFAKERQKTLYDNNPRRQILSIEKIDKIKFDRLPEIHKQIFDNAAKFVFAFTGNIDPEILKPLVEKYIGSIPTTSTVRTWKNDGIIPIRGIKDNIFEIKMETQKTSVAYTWTGDIDYTLENRILIDVLGQVLRMRYTEVIREEKGGSYGVSASGSLSREPKETYMFSVSFDSDKEKIETLGLLDDVTNEFKKIAENGPLADDLSKAKEFLIKQRKDQLKQNNVWLSYLVSLHLLNYDATSDYDKFIDELSIEKIQKLAAKILNDNNLVRVIMNGKAEDNNE